MLFLRTKLFHFELPKSSFIITLILLGAIASLNINPRINTIKQTLIADFDG